jgi:Holliday junction resolvase RusA-like endonuclease
MKNKWMQIDIHGFSVNSMYNGHKKFSKSYRKWRKEIFKLMESLPTLEELNIDINKPMKIEMKFYHARGYDVQNLDKTFIDVLTIHYGLRDDNDFVDVGVKRGEYFTDTEEDGFILFKIENCEGKIMNTFDRLLAAIQKDLIDIY